MVDVPAGARLVLRCAGRQATLRALATVPLVDHCVVPVLASPLGAAIGAGIVDLPTDRGLVRLPARLRDGAGWLEIELSEPLQPLQRRDDVRGPVSLPLRGSATVSPAAGGMAGLMPRVGVAGHTIDISASGLRARVRPEDVANHLGDLYVELDGTGPRPVAAVLEVMALRAGVLRAKFVVISAADREYLAARVFALERAELAARRNNR